MRHAVGVSLACVLALGCYAGADASAETDDVASSGADGSGESGESGAADDGGPAGACIPGDVPPLLRRLTVAEYQASTKLGEAQGAHAPA